MTVTYYAEAKAAKKVIEQCGHTLTRDMEIKRHVTLIPESNFGFRDVVFEDVVFDNNRRYLTL